MDENKTPEDILDEIMNRVTAPPPVPSSSPPEADSTEPDSSEDNPSYPAAEPEAASPSDKTAVAKLLPLPWLYGVLGAALVMLLVCVILLIWMTIRLNALAANVENAQLLIELQEENKSLERDNQVLQRDKEKAEEDLQQSQSRLWSANQDLLDLSESSYYQNSLLSATKKQSQYLWFMDQFADAGDYPMAALVMVLEDDTMNGIPDYWYIPDDMNGVYPELNAAQKDQYLRLWDELIDKGYIQKEYGEDNAGVSRDIPVLAEQWEPKQDIAVLTFLWYMLDAYYVSDNPNAAAQWITAEYEINSGTLIWDKDSLPRGVGEIVSEYTFTLYQKMFDELVLDGYLVQTEAGRYETGDSDDIYYGLPEIPGVSFPDAGLIGPTSDTEEWNGPYPPGLAPHPSNSNG